MLLFISDAGTESVYYNFIDATNKSFTHEGKLNVKASWMVGAGWGLVGCRRLGRIGEVSFPFL